MLLRFSQLIDHLNQRIGYLMALLVPLMILLGVWNVLGRYIGQFVGQNLSSNALIEGQWYVFDLIFLLGAAYTLRHDNHVRVDVFYSNWSPKRKALVNFLGTLLFLLPFCLMVIWASWGNVLHAWLDWEVSPDPGGLPRYPIKSLVIVCFGLLILQGIADAIRNWAILTDSSDLQEPHHDS
jgi:TRAP-type mannitol/chloroaromatic compound transport system permease small subunit